MKKIIKAVLPITIIGVMAGCCCPQPVAKVEKKPIKVKTTTCVPVCKPTVVKVCKENTCPKPIMKQNQTINVNVKVESQLRKKENCELSPDAPIAPYIDYY